MKKTFSRFPIYSILFSVYPIVFLLSRNLIHIRIDQTYRSFFISISITVTLLFGFYLILKDWQRAGIITSLILIIFYSFGHITNAIDDWMINNNIKVNHLAWICAISFLLLCFVFIKVRLPDAFTILLNTLAIVLVLIPVGVIIYTESLLAPNVEHNREILSQMRNENGAEANYRGLVQSKSPDIYFIILDSYERADKLKTFYNFDNSDFINALEERGFYIASASRSNYLNTTYSLNSTLNLLYFHEVPTSIFVKAKSNLYTNHVNDFLRERGYQKVLFQSVTGDVDQQYSDIVLSPHPTNSTTNSGVNSFEKLLIQTTATIILYQRGTLNESFVTSVNKDLEMRRERTEYAFSHLADFADKDGKYFLFSHIYLPHFPFLYDANGDPLKYHEDQKLSWYETEPEDYIDYYIYQIEYLNREVISTIDEIINNSKKPIVIILQADHGDGYFLDWNAPTTEGYDTRSATLNAIYYSDQVYDSLYPTMTPVNTFRLVFNHWLGTNYPLLPDKVFAHNHSASVPPYVKPEFYNICSDYDICLPFPLGNHDTRNN